MSKVIKADELRENPYIIKDAILDTVLLSLPDPDCHNASVTDREFEQSLFQREAEVKEEILRAEALLSEAEEKSQQIFEEAYEKGFQHGQSAGEAKVLEEAESLFKYLRDLGQAVALSQEKIIASAEESIGELALAVAEKIVRREIQTDDSVVQGIIRESLEAVKSGNSIKLKVNVKDMDGIRDCKDVLLRVAGDIRDFEIIEDPRVEQGGCIIETDFGTVDARIDSQLQEIGRAFFGDTRI